MSATGIAHAEEPDDAGQLPAPVASWYARRRYRSEDYPPQLLAQCKGARTVTVIFRPNESGAAPSELVLYGTRTHTIDVPFQFENVPLPQ